MSRSRHGGAERAGRRPTVASTVASLALVLGLVAGLAVSFVVVTPTATSFAGVGRDGGPLGETVSVSDRVQVVLRSVRSVVRDAAVSVAPRVRPAAPGTHGIYVPVGPVRARDLDLATDIDASPGGADPGDADPGDADPDGVTTTVSIGPALASAAGSRGTGTIQPDDEVVAVVVSITVTGHPTEVRVAPSGTARPDRPVVRLGEDGVRSTTTIVPVGEDGSIDLHARAVTADGAASATSSDPQTRRVSVDLLGVFVPAPATPAAAGRFVPTTPDTVVDTRASRDPLTAGSTRTVELGTVVPPDATAAVVRVTAFPLAPHDGTVSLHLPGAPATAVHLGVAATDTARATTTFVDLDAATFALSTTFATDVAVEVLGHVTGASAPASTDGRYVATPSPVPMLDSFRTPDAHSGGTLTVAVTGPSHGASMSVVVANAASFLPEPVAPGADDVRIVSSDQLLLAPVGAEGEAHLVDTGAAVVIERIGAFTGTPDPAAWPAHPSEVRAPVYPTGYCDTIAPGTNGLNEPGTPPVEVRRIGTSVQGRPIWAELHGTRGAPRRAIVVNQVHGDECSLNRLLLALRTTDITDVELWVIPTLTPDGYANGKRRNARDRDLNGDGHTRSEPETWALMSFTEQLRPDLTVHVHSPNGFVGWFGGPASEQLARRIGAGTGLRVSESGARPDRGRWFLWQGQQQFWPHDTVLVEMLAIANQEVPMARPRPPTRSIAVADEHARIVVDELLAHLTR